MFTGRCYHCVIVASLIQLPPWLGSTAGSYHLLVGLFVYLLFVCLLVVCLLSHYHCYSNSGKNGHFFIAKICCSVSINCYSNSGKMVIFV